MTLPDKFKCIVTNWDYIYNLCRDVSNDVKRSGYEPDVIIALARGGWFAGRVLCDFLGLDDLTSLKIEHYTGTAVTGDEPVIKYPLAESVVAGKNVLIVDDITDTGKSMLHAKEYVLSQGPKEVRTATLQHLFCSGMEPEYCGTRLEDWAWIVYPWNFMEDMINIVSQLMIKENRQSWDINAIKKGLYEHHSLDPIVFEITHPGRLVEVLEEMERIGRIRSLSLGDNISWELV